MSRKSGHIGEPKVKNGQFPDAGTQPFVHGAVDESRRLEGINERDMGGHSGCCHRIVPFA